MKEKTTGEFTQGIDGKINSFIRDVCSVTPRPKSEIRERLNEILKQSNQELLKRIVKNHKLPFEAKLCQNRNGIDYCCTCEQAWEQCSCSARNTGYMKCVREILEKTKEIMG